MDLLGILVGPALLVLFAFRGWSVLLLAPVAALVAAAFGREPLLANWTQIFMGSAARFLAPVLSESFFSESSSESSWTKASVRRCACSEVGRVLSAKPSIVLGANTDALFAYVRRDTRPHPTNAKAPSTRDAKRT